MVGSVYRYEFKSGVDFNDVRGALALAIFAVESLHGHARVRLDAAELLDEEGRRCVIDAAGEVGRDLNRIFVGFISREFGEESFRVLRFAKTDALPREEQG